MVRKNAAMCIREVSKHTPELAKLIVNSGGAAALVEYITEAQGNNKLPGIMAIGYISAFSETLALAVIVSKAIGPLKESLVHEPEDHIKAACAWTLGQIGRHTPDHARALAEGYYIYFIEIMLTLPLLIPLTLTPHLLLNIPHPHSHSPSITKHLSLSLSLSLPIYY